MVQREVAERIAAPPGKMSYLSVFVQYHARVRIAFGVAGRRRSSPSRRSSRRSSWSSRTTPTIGWTRPTEDELWRLVQAAFRERRKMIHNVLARQLPVDAGRVDGRPRGGRHRPGPAAPDPRGGGVAGAARGARPDRSRSTAAGGASRERVRRRAGHAADPTRRLSPVVRLAPAKLNLTLAVDRAGATTATTASTRCSCRSALADRLEPRAGRRRPRHAPRRPALDAGPPADNLVLRALAAARDAVGGGWAGRPRAGPGAGGPARQADPGRGRARRRLVGRGRGDRRRARGVGRGARRPTRGCAVAARLGSDVPFFLAGGPALVEGRGEQVAPLDGLHGAPGRPARHAGRSRSRRRTCSPPSTRSGATATARSG